jgi:hypothetical protein
MSRSQPQPRIAPQWPRISISITQTSGHLIFADGEPHYFRGSNLEDTRSTALHHASAIVRHYGSALHIEATEPGGVYRFILDPDGNTTPLPGHARGRRSAPNFKSRH